MLGSLGVIESRHGSGTYVSKLGPTELIGSLTLTLGLAPIDTVLDLYEVRRVLEGHAASLAAVRASEEEISRLGELVATMSAEEDLVEAAKLDATFHEEIGRLSGNEALQVLLSVLRSRNQAFYRLFDGNEGHVRREQSERGHLEIYESIARRDIASAQTAAMHHIFLTERGLKSVMPTADPTDLSGQIISRN